MDNMYTCQVSGVSWGLDLQQMSDMKQEPSEKQ